jgi:hypothetical protein
MKNSNSDENKSISVNLVGGLGNQLFGLAFGLAISNKLKTQLILNTDLIGLGSNATRKLAINNFIFTEKDFLYKNYYFGKFLIFQRFDLLKKIVTKAILKKSYKIMDLNCINMKNSKISKTYTGYFQDWMFADYLISSGVSFYPTLNRFSTEFLNLLNLALDDQPVIIHIRLGDYLYLKNTFSLLPEEYYLSAISKISRKSFPIWLVVENAQEASKFYPKIIKMADKIIDKSYGVEDHEVFYLMSKSSKLVVSNSTFSLWAGWFAINDNAKVIVPSEFIVDGVKSLLIDGRWDRIDVISFDFIEKESLNEIRKQSMAKIEGFLLN